MAGSAYFISGSFLIMKKWNISLIILLLLFGFLSMIRAQEMFYLRVEIKTFEDLLPLIRQGFTMPDVIVHPSQNGLLIEADVSWISDNGFVTVVGGERLAAALQAMGYNVLSQGVIPEHKNSVAPETVLPNQFGWPKTMVGWPGVYGQATTVDDMNGNGRPEIFLNNIEGFIYGWRYNATYVPSYPRNPYKRFLGLDPQTGDSVYATWATTGSPETGAMGDIDGDGIKEFIFGKDIGYLFACPYGPGFLNGFPMDLGLAVFTNAPALYDFDKDGKNEMVLVSYLWPTGSATYGPADVHILNEDGSEMEGWPNQIPVNSECSPVVGDIDGDSEMEIVTGSGRDPNLNIPGQLFAWNLDGSLCDGFPIQVGNAVSSTPSLADIDMNGIVDILIRISMSSTGVNGVYAFNGQGKLLAGFPAVIPRGGTRGAPAVADMDDDGLPEIAIGTALAVDSGMVYVYNYDGSLKSGFPTMVNATWVEESVALADVSGDGLPDVIATTNGVSNDPGKVWAFDYRGDVVDGFPILTEPIIGSSLESAPSVVDIDGDGDTEIFTANWDGTVFCWDSPGLVSPGNAWPMFKFDAQRTGNGQLVPTAISSSGNSKPESFRLLCNYPNPFNPRTTIVFSLDQAAPVTLRIFNPLGERVRTLIDHHVYQPGQHRISFEAGQLASGIYIYELETARHRRLTKMILLK
jgi:hypothetical protein